MTDIDIIVVGRGLIGSATARQLAKAGASVVLIGPGEPEDNHSHNGVFGSHYDSGRIVRILDPDPYYAQIAKASIEQYRSLENQTGISFFHEVGYLSVTNNSDYYSNVEAVGKMFFPDAEHFLQKESAERFPYFNFPADVQTIYQQNMGGYINPRMQISAQNKALAMYSGSIIDDVVLEIRQKDSAVFVHTNNEILHCRKVILITGAYANIGGLIPREIEYEIVPHTIVFGEIAKQQLPALKGMPSLSYRYGNDQMRYIYFMPPVLYPDGKHYVKIGHSFGDTMPIQRESLTRWFQSDGDMTRVEWLKDTLKNLLPDISFNSFSSKSCVTTKSPTGKQYIDQFEDTQIYSLLADNGQCAKSADEVGSIATEFVLNGRFPSTYNQEDFRLQYSH